MRFNRSLGLAAIIFSLSCYGQNGISQPERKITITGVPLSVVQNFGTSSGCLATVIVANAKQIVAFNCYGFRQSQIIAGALLQAEIADGDNEQISLEGTYETKNVFSVESLKVSGYRIDLLEDKFTTEN